MIVGEEAMLDYRKCILQRALPDRQLAATRATRLLYRAGIMILAAHGVSRSSCA